MGISHFENQALKKYCIVFQIPRVFFCLFNSSAKRVHLSFIVRTSSQLPKQCKLHIYLNYSFVSDSLLLVCFFCRFACLFVLFNFFFAFDGLFFFVLRIFFLLVIVGFFGTVVFYLEVYTLSIWLVW